MIRDLILKFGVIALLLCAICIGVLSSFAGQEVKQLSYLADDEPPSETPLSTSVRKKRASALAMIYSVRTTGYLACGIGITTLMYCLVRERRMEKRFDQNHLATKIKEAEQGGDGDAEEAV